MRPTLAVTACLLLCVCFAIGQVNTGEIRLQVKDPSGAALRASGRVTGPGTNRTFQTDAQGAFSLSGLAFGRTGWRSRGPDLPLVSLWST